jgi:hypothetical protein
LTLAGRVRVDATSEQLLQEDTEVENVDRAAYEKMARTDAERLKILERLRTHTQLLAQYFSRLGELASGNAGADVASSTNSIAASLNQIGKELRGSAILSNKDIAGKIASKLVEIKASGLLRRELEARAESIREEIATQEELLAALRDDVSKDLEVIATLRTRRTVLLPLTSPARIANPDQWIAARQQATILGGLPEELAAASTAARELRSAFEALAGSGRADSVNAASLRVRELQSQMERIP